MPEMRITIPRLPELRKKFKKFPAWIAAGLSTAIKISAWEITREVQKETPVKTGSLKRSIVPRFSHLRAVIEPKAKYAIFVHEGTRPHTIFPTRKKALYWKGALHPVMSVQHPGTKANRFMERGLDNAKPKVEATFKKVIDKTLKKIN